MTFPCLSDRPLQNRLPMRELDEKKRLEQVFSLRNISFGLMVMAIVFSFSIQSDRNNKKQATEKFKDLQARNTGFLVDIVESEALGSSLLTGEMKQSKAKEVEQYFAALNTRPGMLPDDLAIQQYVLLTYMGERPKEMPYLEEKDSLLVRQFLQLYRNQKPLAGVDVMDLFRQKEQFDPDNQFPLLKLPAGDMIALYQLDLENRKEEKDRTEKEMIGEALQRISIYALFIYGGIITFLASLVILYLFYKKRPRKRYFRTIRNLPKIVHGLMMETAIVYLFLMFPATAFLMKQAPWFFSFQNHLLYIVGIFVLSLVYFINNGGGLDSLLKMLYEKGRFSFLKEILWGVIGFVAIFPVAIISTLFTLAMAGESGGDVRFVHPIVFQLKDHILEVFLFSVFVVPVMEEIIFRGFLYGFFRRIMRIRTAAVLTGVIFAILHPQGWVALPYLTILGMGLAILREYRPGILAPMVTHGIVNALAAGGAYMIFYSS